MDFGGFLILSSGAYIQNATDAANMQPKVTLL